MKTPFFSYQKNIFLTVLLVCCYAMSAQNIEGVVYDYETQKPLEYVVIKLKNTNKWTATNKKGHFSIDAKKLPATLSFHYMGKLQIEKHITTTAPITVYMKDDNLRLSEVQVTAKMKKKSTGSTVTLGRQAIELVQAQSLADVLQLVPGNTIAETELHERQILTMRSAIFNNTDKYNTGTGLGVSNNPFLINNSFGIGYLIDDIPINTNGELSGNRATNVGLFQNTTEFNSVGYGLDLRSIGLENIEDIEVVQGISSARYGDHNTGLVKIRKKLGETPYRAKATLRGGSYSLELTKGFDLPKNWGQTNIGVEYLHSNSDPRNSLTKFDRIRFSGQWELRKKGKMKNRFAWSYAKTIDSYNKIDNEVEERTKSYKHWQARLSNTHTRYFDSAWLDRFTGTVSLNYAVSDTETTQLVNSGGRPIATTLTEGTFEVGYTPVSYYTLEQVNSVPFSVFSRLEGRKNWDTEHTNYRLLFGATVSVEDNLGKGSLVNSDQSLLYASPTSAGSGKAGWRNVNFNDIIPTEINLGLYTTTHIKTVVFGKKWATDIGFRYDNFNSKSSYSPRINTKLTWNKHFKSRLGIGFFTKAPSLQTLYRPPVYYDYLLADYRNNYYAFALMHTLIRNYSTDAIKPSKTWKLETGLDYKNKWFNASLTAYYNKQSDGFTNKTTFEMANVPKYEFTTYPKKAPDYTQVGFRTILLKNRTVANDLTSENYGIELMGSTKKIAAINTSFSFSMAYRYTKTSTNLPGSIISNLPDTDYWIGLHKNVPTSYEKLNSSITAVHHISKLGLVVTLTAEQFLMATTNSYARVVYPYAYYDRNLNYHKIPEAKRTDDYYSYIRKSGTGAVASSDYIPRIFGNYHLKVAKEFKNGLRFSFYAINFLNYMPYYEKLNSDNELQRTRFNRPISFGGNVIYQF